MNQHLEIYLYPCLLLVYTISGQKKLTGRPELKNNDKKEKVVSID